MTSWWQRDPDRYKKEIDALEEAKISYSIRRKDEKTGFLIIHLEYPVDNEVLQLVALYPAEYPFFPVQVNAPNLELTHHQNPVTRNLCLLGNPTRDWSVDQTLVGLLKGQLRKVIKTATEPGGEFTAQNETHQGEPWSDYAPYNDSAQLIIGNFEIPLELTHGHLIWALEKGKQLRGALLQILDANNNIVAEAEAWIQKRYSDCENYRGEWQRIKSNPPIHSPQAHFDSVCPSVRKKKRTSANRSPQLAGTLYSEEVRWRKNQDGWVFSVYIPKGNRRSSGHHFLRPAHANEKDLFARTPELHAIRNKHILIVGLGMLGSPATLQLAKAGIGKLTLCDSDYVELGTVPRWALGWMATGRSKAGFLEEYIHKEYPYVNATSLDYPIGNPFWPPGNRLKLENALKEADLVFDATADACVNNYLRTECLSRGKPHVWIETNPGCWGGIVGRYLPGKSGCWACMKFHQNDKKIPIPIAPYVDDVQPAGCRTPTTTGSGFDSDVVVLEGVRMAVGILSQGVGDGYPLANWDVGIVNLRSKEGNLQLPSWEKFDLPTHPKCNHG